MNPYNEILQKRRAELTRAKRTPIAPAGCAILHPPPAAANNSQTRRTLQSARINCNIAGDNILIPARAGRKLIYEIFLWNVAAQTLILSAGPSANGLILDQITNAPALAGFLFGFNGNFEMPHFDLDPGQLLTLNLQNSTQVDGFIRYTVARG